MLMRNILFRSINTQAGRQHRPVPPVKKAVLISTSQNIYENLALESWLYKNGGDFTDRHLLMLWVNKPCVVIGRHQNPWLEANVQALPELDVKLARRNSGGGTVYHDGGNLNLTFFTAPQHYNRRFNLDFIAHSIYNEFGLKVDVSPREDLTVRDYKVSGTAAKLARLCAYHHCTLLVNADKSLLHQCLANNQHDIKTNATRSTKSKIINLHDECAEITIDSLIKSLGIAYLRHNNANFVENNPELYKQLNDCNENFNSNKISSSIDYDGLKLQVCDGCEAEFPGLDEIKQELTNWKWIYGKTPKFTVSKLIKIATKKFPKVIYTTSRTYAVNLQITVEHGRIEDVSVQIPQTYNSVDLSGKIAAMRECKGAQYHDGLMAELERLFVSDLDVLQRQIST